MLGSRKSSGSSGRNITKGAVGILAGIILLIAVALLYWGASSGQVITLRDGAKWEIAAVTFGREQEFVYGTGWEQLVYFLLPQRFLGAEKTLDNKFYYWRFKDFEGRKVQYSSEDGSMVLWSVCPRKIARRQLQAVALDGEGNPFALGKTHRIQTRGYEQIIAWEFERFPRGQRTIDFQLIGEENENWKPVARFKVPNPDSRDYPAWEPEPLPAIKGEEGIAVTLTEVKTGDHPAYRAPNHSGIPGRYHPYETRIGFVVRENGRPTTDWRPVLFEWMDVAGYRKRDWYAAVHDNDNEEQARILPRLIGPGEPVKVRIGLRPAAESGFDEAKLFRVNDFPVGSNRSSNATTNLGEVSVTIATMPKHKALLQVDFDPDDKGYHAMIVEARTDKGRSLRLREQRRYTSGNFDYFLPIPVSGSPSSVRQDKDKLFFGRGDIAKITQSLDLTAAVYRIRHFEFVVSPQRFSQRWNEVSPADVPQLIEALQDEDRMSRWNAAEALKRLGPGAEQAVPDLIRVLSDHSQKVRWSAVSALGEIGGGAAEASDELVRLLEDRQGSMAGLAAKALGQIGASPETVVPALVKALEEPNLRLSVLGAIGEFGSEARQAVPKLFELLEQSQVLVQAMAIQTLAVVETDRKVVLPKVIPFLKSPNQGVRNMAIQAIGKVGIPSKETILSLLDVVQNAEKSASRNAALEVMASLLGIRLSNSAREQTIRNLLEHPDPEIRNKAARLFETEF